MKIEPKRMRALGWDLEDGRCKEAQRRSRGHSRLVLCWMLLRSDQRGQLTSGLLVNPAVGLAGPPEAMSIRQLDDLTGNEFELNHKTLTRLKAGNPQVPE